MVTNIFPVEPLLRPWGQTVKIHFFSEHDHVAYQIKGNDERSNMQAHILSLHIPSSPRVASNVNTFFPKNSHIVYQIKGTGT